MVQKEQNELLLVFDRHFLHFSLPHMIIITRFFTPDKWEKMEVFFFGLFCSQVCHITWTNHYHQEFLQ